MPFCATFIWRERILHYSDVPDSQTELHSTLKKSRSGTSMLPNAHRTIAISLPSPESDDPEKAIPAPASIETKPASSASRSAFSLWHRFLSTKQPSHEPQVAVNSVLRDRYRLVSEDYTCLHAVADRNLAAHLTCALIRHICDSLSVSRLLSAG